MPLYHGGVAGLRVGDYLLPPSRTHARSCSDFGADGSHSNQHVYLTPSVQLALRYAALVSRHPGWVYEVVPLGAVEHDPDPVYQEPGRSFQCDAAVIVAILYRCTQADTVAAWRFVFSSPLRRFVSSVLEG
jgi:hypothetical protein